MASTNTNSETGVVSDALFGRASFDSLSRDLYWSIFIEGKTCRWSGYDDGYWWSKVATSDQFQVREHQGKRYRLNPMTNQVFLCPNNPVSDDAKRHSL